MTRRNVFKIGTTGLFGLGGVGSAAVGWFIDERLAHRMIRSNRRPLSAEMTDRTIRPAHYGLRLEPWTLPAADGVILSGLHVMAAPHWGLGLRRTQLEKSLRTAGVPLAESGAPPRGMIALLHGLNGRKEHLLDICQRFTLAGYQCLIWDSRAHGTSGGEYVTYGAYEVDDACRIITYAQERWGHPGRKKPLGLWGYSMGAAVALQLLPHLPEVHAIVAVAPFADLSSVMAHQADRRHAQLRKLLPLVQWDIALRARFDPTLVRPIDAVRRSHQPLFLQHGQNDTVIPPEHSRRLLAAAGPSRATLRLVPAATHHDVLWRSGDAPTAHHVQFLQQHECL
jgi:uncharacterized protein